MNTQIEIVNSWTLTKLISELESGHIKIPKFQRNYIWERSKVLKLIESVYRQYPIGTIFLWCAPSEFNDFIREAEYIKIKRKATNKHVEFIIDGQQRIMSLYACLRGIEIEGTDYSKICFHVKKQEFHIPRQKIERFNIPLFNLFDENAFRDICEDLKRYDQNHNSSVAPEWIKCHDIFINYPVSIVKTKTADLDEVVEIFERINQGGSRLTLMDLVHATVLNSNFDLKASVNQANSTQFFKKYGEIPVRTYVNSLSINVFRNCANASLLKLTPEICYNIWPGTVNSLIKAIEFLISMGIQTEINQYHSLLPVLQFYFYLTNNDLTSETRKKLEKWFWDTKFTNRYAGSNSSKIKEDINWISDVAGN